MRARDKPDHDGRSSTLTLGRRAGHLANALFERGAPQRKCDLPLACEFGRCQLRIGRPAGGSGYSAVVVASSFLSLRLASGTSEKIVVA
jgi:hypothetical protein